MIPYINNRPNNPRLIQFLKNILHYGEAFLSNLFFRYPKDKITIIGVTGTDGKTTTVNLIHHILTLSGRKTAIFSTLSTAHTSSPGRGRLQRFIKQSYDNHCTHAVIEVTSIGAHQYRADFINFTIGVLTNIANNEHLDYHRSFENYQKAKLRFLLACKNIIINADDSSFNYVKQNIKNQTLTSYAIKESADLNPRKIAYSTAGTAFELNGQLINTKLVGPFNLQNTLAAIGACLKLGLTIEEIAKAIKSFTSPSGRLEIVATKPATIIVDFAHTPQAFEKVLPVAKSFLGKGGRLIHVFGATGSRDKGKRPLMAKISAKYSNRIILTHEDTYLEPAEKIISQIESGLVEERFENYQKIFDRKEAITSAIKISGPGDVIIITGVGHQKSLNIGGKEIPWSDQKVVEEILKKRR